MLGGAGSPGGEEILTVTIVRDALGYGMKVSGDKPVYVQSVKEHGAAWRAGLRAGDRILRVDGEPVHHHTHQQVVHMIRAHATTVLTVHQSTQRLKTPITAPVPVNSEKQRQLEFAKVHTVRMMLEKEQKFIRDLRNELSKVPDVRKQTQLESAEQRCAKLQQEIDTIVTTQPMDLSSSHPHLAAPATPKLGSRKSSEKLGTSSPPPNNSTGFLSNLPRSLSNLTGQSLTKLRQARQSRTQQENQPPLVRQNSDESNNKRRHGHNNTVPMVPTTCLDNVTPPPLPPRSTERPKRHPLSPTFSPPLNPLAVKPKAGSSVSPMHKQYYPNKFGSPMHQSMPGPEYREDNAHKFRRSSHSLDGELDVPQPNSIALQMSYPLVNAPPPPLQMDNRTGVPVLHVRSQSSPEHLDHGLRKPEEKEVWERSNPPPGTPPPPYAHNTQPCADPQRAIISMEEDDDPASDNSTYSGLFSNLRSVRESKAKTAVLLNWLIGERRCACANLLLLITDGYRAATGVSIPTLRRWAYEIQSTFLMPNAVLQLNGVDENMANEIEHVLANDYEKEELLRNVFRKARQKAKEELAQQLSEFCVKRQVGLATLYGPEDAVLEQCQADKAQEQLVVERVMSSCLAAGGGGGGGGGPPCAPHDSRPPRDAHCALTGALVAAAQLLHCRPATVAAAVGGSKPSFLQRDKLYKQRVKQLTKQHPQPYVVRGHHLYLQALTSVAHCHLCDHVIGLFAPQAYVCNDCNLRVHRECAKAVEEPCCLDGEHHNNRISRFMERIHPNQTNQDIGKSRKTSGAAHFLNMERSFRRVEDEPAWETAAAAAAPQERRDESDESLYESADGQSDAISASDDALPRLKTPAISKESLKVAITDEEVEAKPKKGHRKTMSLSNPLEIVRNLGDEWLETTKKETERDKRKSKESLWSEEDKESVHGSTSKLDQIRKNSKKENKRKSDGEKRKSSKSSSVSALNFLRRKKTSTVKAVEAVAEDLDRIANAEEIMNCTKYFIEQEQLHTATCEAKPYVDSETDEDIVTPKLEHRRRLSRQTSRGKSKARGKSQTVNVNTLRKSHSGTLKKNKKKGVKTPIVGRSRQASVVEATPLVKKKHFDTGKQSSWLFHSVRGEPKREGSSEEPLANDADADVNDAKEPEKETSWRPTPSSGGRGVNRAESCRERDVPRRGKHRNASDPNRLTAHNNHDLEPGAATAPSGSSSSSSLSSRSNESNTIATESQEYFEDGEVEEPLPAQWAKSLPPQVLDSLLLSSRLRKRQEVIHELIVSEISHVRWLRVLGDLFLKPLESWPTLLPAEELRALFPNLPGVRERHSKLCTELKQARNEATNHVLHIRPVADAMLNTLGDSGYANCLSRFCRGQRMALEALRERRRKNKELHQLLSSKEQSPQCGRLQLRDLLACVWQRLTKYQLLLESILQTVADEDSETEEDVARLKQALDVAKDVLHSVDTAIRTAENEHRLKTIQNKLEVRASGNEWEELRRLDLTQRKLRMEGQLTIRNDTNKKINVLALMFEDVLILLQQEGDKFILKPFTQRSQQELLSPMIRWDKVLFRANAAVRNTFFLMNINGIQMHELSANTNAEYSTWVKYIQEVPLAKPSDLKSGGVHPPRAVSDDSGTNVSRNPSDASEKSSSTVPIEENSEERASIERDDKRVDKDDRRSVETERRSVEGERRSVDGERASIEGDRRSVEGARRSMDGDRRSVDKDCDEEERHKPRRPTVGRISTHGRELTAPLESSAAIVVSEPAAQRACVAAQMCTQQERLRRLDEVIAKSLKSKSAIVGELLGVPQDSLADVADLAIADTLGQVDICRELRATRLERSVSVDEPTDSPQADMHQLLLAAHAQANQLTEIVAGALSVNETAIVASRSRRRGHCDNCRDRRKRTSTLEEGDEAPPLEDPSPAPAPAAGAAPSAPSASPLHASLDQSFDMLNDLSAQGDLANCSTDGLVCEADTSGAALAARLAPLTSGLQRALGSLLATVPRALAAQAQLRAEAAALRDCADRRRHENQINEEISPANDGLDQTIQDQPPSNGG